jgi:hypothetical protein|tara:strand:- start:346 stop:582 length:237 start_codon:yes stop_codon:yes gene_type:complete
LINLIYIRAAIRERTGQELPIEEVLQLLVQEGLVTKAQARHKDIIFRGYAEYFEYEEAAKFVEDPTQFIDRKAINEDE